MKNIVVLKGAKFQQLIYGTIANAVQMLVMAAWHYNWFWFIIIIIILFAREQYSKQVQMTVEMSRTIRRKDTHLQMPFNIDS